MSAHVIDKAQRLLAKERVVEHHHNARVFRVLGDGGQTHTVVIDDVGVFCSCDAGRLHHLCSHLLVARLLMDREQVAT